MQNGVRVGGLRQLHFLDSKAVAETIIVDQHDWAWVAGLWQLGLGEAVPERESDFVQQKTFKQASINKRTCRAESE